MRFCSTGIAHTIILYRTHVTLHVHASSRFWQRALHRGPHRRAQPRRSPPHHAPGPPAPSQAAWVVVACPPLREIARDCEIRGDTMLQVLATVASSAARSPTVATLDVPATRHGHCGLGRGAGGASGATSRSGWPPGRREIAGDRGRLRRPSAPSVHVDARWLRPAATAAADEEASGGLGCSKHHPAVHEGALGGEQRRCCRQEAARPHEAVRGRRPRADLRTCVRSERELSAAPLAFRRVARVYLPPASTSERLLLRSISSGAACS